MEGWANRSRRGGSSQRVIGGCLVCVLGLTLAPAFFLVNSWSQWNRPELLLGLAVLAVLTLFGEVRFKAFMYFVPHDALITVALVIGGPLPTLIVFLLGDVPHRVVTRRLPLASPGAWATYVSYGWASIAG